MIRETSCLLLLPRGPGWAPLEAEQQCVQPESPVLRAVCVRQWDWPRAGSYCHGRA